jgi:cytosine/adenosine deaminase-related metal-dependent hydrolase
LRTLINGSYVIAFDGNDHRIIKNGQVVFEGNEITYVGKHYSGKIENEIDATGKMVIPGLISMHTHASIPTCERLLPDVGRKDFYGSGVFNCVPVSGIEGGLEEKSSLGVKFAINDALRHGCTTIVEVGGIGTDSLLKTVGESGVRAYVGPSFRSAIWSVDRDGSFEYLWNEEKGFKDLEKAINFTKKNDGAYNKRISCMLYPLQADTCTPELLRETNEQAQKLGVKVQIHAAQNLFDFHETLRRYKKTPIKFLFDSGILNENLIIAHCIFISGHSWTAYPGNMDLQMLSESNASIAHCPLVYARRGIRLESYQKYLDQGVNVSIGMDTYPRDIISEMRLASYLSKVVDQDYASGSSAEIFRSATTRAAYALNRTDLGKICKGAKADIVIVNLNKLHIGPVFDPIKSLVNCANGSDVETVIIDGEILVENGRLKKVDEDKLMKDVEKATIKSWGNIPNWHWAKSTASEISPPSFESWRET